MKKLFILALFISVSYYTSAKNLAAFFSYSSFDVPGKSPFLETYLHVYGSSVNFSQAENNLRYGQIEVKWIIRSGDKIIQFDKYNLISPGIAEGENNIPDFVDQQRIGLENGSYQIELSVRDKNSEANETTIKQDFTIDFPTDTISISDIEFIDSYSKTIMPGKFSKNGYDIFPFINAFYSKEKTSLKFYTEIYRTDKFPGDDFVLRYYISNKESRQVLDNYIAQKRQNPKSTNVIIAEFEIEDLPSGNYYLNIEIRNKSNSLIAFQQSFFQRSNDRNKPVVSADISAIDIRNTFVSSIINKDTLIDYINCLYPISTSLEEQISENQVKLQDIHSMQQYLYYFWSLRNRENPEKAWADYRLEVMKVNNSFSTLNKKGYETERGRVYLHYGPPNTISASQDDPQAYPYEIWQYYKLSTQSNRKFVFYTNDRSSNDFRLLHSDAIGELQEPNWELKLHERTQQFGIDLDQQKSIDVYGSHSKDNYVNPH